jgi:hypothetical protein
VGELAKKVFEAFGASPSEKVDDRAREAVIPLDQTLELMPSTADLTALDDHPPRSVHKALGEDVYPIAVKVWSAMLDEAIGSWPMISPRMHGPQMRKPIHSKK